VKRRSGAELAGVVQRAHCLEAGLDLGQQGAVLVVELARLGHPAVKAFVGERQHAVGQVPPGRHQLVVVPWGSTKSSQENRRRRVARLGGGGGQVVAQGVGIVSAQEVRHVDGGAAALAELAATKVQVFMVTMHKFLSP
jgi:hypothetical protein